MQIYSIYTTAAQLNDLTSKSNFLGAVVAYIGAMISFIAPAVEHANPSATPRPVSHEEPLYTDDDLLGFTTFYFYSY